MITAIESVAVGDRSIDAVIHEGSVWVSVRRVCAALDLDPAGQRRMLLDKPWAKTAVLEVLDSEGRKQEGFMLALKSLPMWLGNINHKKVAPGVAGRLVCFQMEAHDALARHFGLSGREEIISSRPSGGAVGSGRTPTTASTGGAGSGSALQVLSMVEGLAAAMRETIGEVAVVRADLTDHKALVEEKTRIALEASQRALASAHDAAAVADRAARAGGQAREHRRRIDAAVGTCTSAIRQWCTKTGTPYQKVYSEVRADLGLRRTQDGGPALGRAKLRADQVLRMARTATMMGVPGVGAAVINAILNGEDAPTPPQPPRLIPPRADDIEVLS